MEKLEKKQRSSKRRSVFSFLCFFVIFFNLACSLVLFPSFCKAKEQVSKHVYDHANYFSDKKREKLESLCFDYGEQTDANIILLIEDGIEQGGWKSFMEDFYDKNDTEFGDCAMLLLDVNEEERRIEIQGYGEMEYIITDARIEDIIDEIFDDLKAGKYYKALASFPVLVAQYKDMGYGQDARKHTQQDNETYDPYYYEKKNSSIYFLCCIPIALIIGGIVTAVLVVRSGGATTTTFHNYINENRRSLIGRYDRYTHTTTSKRRKPRDTTNHSGGGGVSSGGHSHSGGGRSF